MIVGQLVMDCHFLSSNCFAGKAPLNNRNGTEAEDKNC